MPDADSARFKYNLGQSKPDESTKQAPPDVGGWHSRSPSSSAPVVLNTHLDNQSGNTLPVQVASGTRHSSRGTEGVSEGRFPAGSHNSSASRAGRSCR